MKDGEKKLYANPAYPIRAEGWNDGSEWSDGGWNQGGGWENSNWSNQSGDD